jgi:hypothetical protein
MEKSAGQALPVSAVLNGPSTTIPCPEEQVTFFYLQWAGMFPCILG